MSKRRLGIGVVVCSATLLLGGVASGAAAEADPVATLGQWTAPFEEGGSGTPRCVPDDDARFTVCKPTANAASVLPDGRVFYYMGLEGHEDQQRPSTVLTASPSARNGQVRLLDLRDGTPRWTTPSPDRGGRVNPDIQEGKSDYHPGVPGRPGDGFVGSTWGRLGGPPSEPNAPPDDPADNDGDLFCSDQVLLPDGRVFLVGGTDWYNEPSIMDRNAGDQMDVGIAELEGLRNATFFDPATDTFSEASPMKYGRWYSANVVGADGRPTVFAGVTQLITNNQLSAVRRSETYDVATDTWSENYVGDGSENSLPLMPRMFLAPNGKFFYSGVGQMFGPNGMAIDEATFALQQFFDPEAKTWEVAGVAPLGARSGAFVVPLVMQAPYEQMTLLSFGGTLGSPPGSHIANPLATLTDIDSLGQVTNRLTGNLNHARWFANGVLLPDGQILAVGGGDKDAVIDPGFEMPIKTAELYDPETGSWTDVASHARDRTYHHMALLLPDMRVLLGGHAPIAAHYGGPNTDQGGPFANNDPDPSFEIWSPPYLFRGPRPEISRVQAGIDYGEHFPVETPHAAEIESVMLMGIPSPNHVTDPDQRALSLEFRPGDGILEVTAPPSGAVAPPNTYYLVVNKKSPQGPVPSVARMVRVGTGRDTADAIAPFGSGGGGPEGSATALDDSSMGAELGQNLEQAREGAPAGKGASVAAGGATRVPTPEPALPAGAAETGSTPGGSVGPADVSLPALPARSNSPLRSPALPLAAVGAAGLTALGARRALRRCYCYLRR